MEAPQTPKLLVDCCVIKKPDKLVLIRRKYPPYRGQYALPGGFVDIGETVEQACTRELREETGLVVGTKDLELIGVFSDPQRDPRGHGVSVAFHASFPDEQHLDAGDDAAQAMIIKYDPELEIGFDHHDIIQKAMNKIYG